MKKESKYILKETAEKQLEILSNKVAEEHIEKYNVMCKRDFWMTIAIFMIIAVFILGLSVINQNFKIKDSDALISFYQQLSTERWNKYSACETELGVCASQLEDWRVHNVCFNEPKTVYRPPIITEISAEVTTPYYYNASGDWK